MNTIILFLVVALSSVAECEDESITDVEPRGKGKYALLMHFFYVVATKLFILKVIYGIIFYILLTKGWHFVLWFTQYLKKKEHHVEYVDHDYHGHHDHYEPPYHGYGPGPYQGYGSYEYDKNGYEYAASNVKPVYDSDGSYSVKNTVRG